MSKGSGISRPTEAKVQGQDNSWAFEVPDQVSRAYKPGEVEKAWHTTETAVTVKLSGGGSDHWHWVMREGWKRKERR